MKITMNNNNIIKNTFKTILLAILSLTFLLGCSSEKAIAKAPTIEEITKEIEEAIDISEMKKGDINKLKKLYDIDEDEIEDFVLYVAPTNIKADEMAIIKVKDENNIESIKEKISTRISDQGSVFESYLPEEYFLIEKHVLKSNGNYVLLVVSKDATKVEGIFDNSFK